MVKITYLIITRRYLIPALSSGSLHAIFPVGCCVWRYSVYLL